MQSLNENLALDLIIAGIKDFVGDQTITKFYKSAKGSLDKNKIKNSNKLTSSSIMSASKDLVMSFPVICSTSISPDTALMIQRAIERNCVSTLQMLFASASLKGMNGIDVIKQWHNNMNTDPSIDDYFNYIEAIGTGLNTIARESGIDYMGTYGQRMIDECKRNLTFYPVSSFSENSLMSYELSYNNMGETEVKFVNESKPPVNKYDKSNKSYTGLYAVIKDRDNSPQGFSLYTVPFVDAQEMIANGKEIEIVNTFVQDEKKNQINKDELQLKKDDLAVKQQELKLKTLAGRQDYLQKQLLDSDIKKANELVPSMMIIQYDAVDPNYVDDGRGKKPKILKVDEFVAGVKARLIGVDSVEMVDRIRLALESKVDLKNFLRATTGEIKFCKDFILAIDQAKIEARRNSKLSKTSPIWRALQNRSTKSSYNRMKRTANTAAAITSLVISSAECNRLKMDYNIDMYSVAKCRQVMQAYNFMQIVIVDDALEVAKFLLDNDDKYFQDYSYAALRKEASDSEMKKLINVVSAANRG